MRRIQRLTSMVGAASLVLGTMAVSVATTSAVSASTSFKACAVLDTGGVNDKSFNQGAWEGMKAAKSAMPGITIKYLTSTSSTDYTPNVNIFMKQGCGLIITVGFNMDAATVKASNANLKQKFAIIDDAPVTKSKNVLGIQFATDQSGFLGGMLAAGLTKTGTVATYGGQPFPGVTLYENGFVAGVRYWDKMSKAKVKVLGWTPGKGACSVNACNGKGTMVGNFTDQTAGKTLATSDFAAGADIIFPVAGSVGLGSLAAAKQAGKGKYIMWVDSDACKTDPTNCKYYVGTVTKGVKSSVQATVLAAAKGTFKGGSYLGTLANMGTTLTYGGVMVPASLKAKIATAQAGIIAGKISVNPNSYPATPK